MPSSGRLVVHFKINQGRVSTKYFLKEIMRFIVEIKESSFEGDEFRYESVELPFSSKLKMKLTVKKHRGNLHLFRKRCVRDNG